MGMPRHIEELLKVDRAPAASSGAGRKVWDLDLETVWLPFFRATNAQGRTHIPDEALNLAYGAHGSVPKELREAIRLVQENFKGTLQDYAKRSSERR